MYVPIKPSKIEFDEDELEWKLLDAAIVNLVNVKLPETSETPM